MSSDSQRVPRKTLSAQQVSRESTWWDKDNKDCDAVVFIHGILGDQIGTRGHFPALLQDDPDLPKLAILHWDTRAHWCRADTTRTTRPKACSRATSGRLWKGRLVELYEPRLREGDTRESGHAPDRIEASRH